MNNKVPCLPVKITDKKWANSLQNGSLFMRSMHDYGSWSAIKRNFRGDGLMKDNVQIDISEGIIKKIDPKVGDDYFNLFEDNLRAVMQDASYIDIDRYQYYKIFCMYGLTFFTNKKEFERPDVRVAEFGDTAVIIYNPNEFLNRVLKALYAKFGNNINFRLDEVHYYPHSYYGDLDEFCKNESFAWQNEMRIRVALLDENIFILDADGRKHKQLIQDTNPIILDIGNMEDISVQIPVQDLINLNLPPIIQLPI